MPTPPSGSPRCSRRSPTRFGFGCCRSWPPTQTVRRACATSTTPSTCPSRPSATTSRCCTSAGLLDRSKRGVWVYYRVDAERTGGPRRTDRRTSHDRPEPRRPSCSSACTTQAVPRWRPGTCSTWREIGSTCCRPAPSQPIRSIPSRCRRWPRRASTSGAEQPKLLTDSTVRTADVVITMGCGDACPFYPGKRYEDWDLDDPAGQRHRDGQAHPGRDQEAGRVAGCGDRLEARA